MSSNQTTIMHIPTDMVPLIQQIIDLRPKARDALAAAFGLNALTEAPPSRYESDEEESDKNAFLCFRSIAETTNWMEEQKVATGMSETEIVEAGLSCILFQGVRDGEWESKRYKNWCYAAIATMREKEPERLAKFPDKYLWKYLGTEWYKSAHIGCGGSFKGPRGVALYAIIDKLRSPRVHGSAD